MSTMAKISEYLELIKFEHTIFALPFAFSGMLLASKATWPPVMVFLWVLLAMVGGRTAAMALNRVIDAEIDVKNPRTSSRAIPAGRIKKISALVLAFLSFGVMACATWQLPLICRQLLPLAIIILVLYSYTKRFTHLSHFVLGGALGAGAAGGWLAVTGEITLPVVLWGLAVVFWVAGFDVIYALQDLEFDRENKLYSIPVMLGESKSLMLARIFHAVTVISLVVLGFILNRGIYYNVGVGLAALLLIYEHSLLKAGDLSKINMAFFNVNGFVSVAMMCFIILDKVVK